jgi:uncharacterized protein (TIGR03083 family)
MPDKQFYIDAVRSDADATLQAARLAQPPLPPIAGCPGWNMGDLIIHLGDVHRRVTRRVERREREFLLYGEGEWEAIQGLPPAVQEWELSETPPADRSLPPELFTWFEEGARHLADVLQAADPGERIGTWFPPDQTAGFWQRRMAQETAVHRWDAQEAVGTAQPIEGDLARDGIDEVFDVMVPQFRRGNNTPAGAGESYHFHRTDGEGEWLLRFEGDRVSVTHDHEKAAVAVRGSASDLLLFLWGRPVRDRLEVLGDAALLDRYFELVPAG